LQISLLKENLLEITKNNKKDDIFKILNEEQLNFYTEYNVFKQVNKYLDNIYPNRNNFLFYFIKFTNELIN
jgi:hypothetical protein